jgi:hypothetical protein
MRPSVKVYFFAEGSWKLSAKNFQKPFLCRGLALGKETANDTDTVTTAFLCRVPGKGPSAKTTLPSKNFSRDLC